MYYEVSDGMVRATEQSLKNRIERIKTIGNQVGFTELLYDIERIEDVKSGEYKNWVEKNYEKRDAK